MVLHRGLHRLDAGDQIVELLAELIRAVPSSAPGRAAAAPSSRSGSSARARGRGSSGSRRWSSSRFSSTWMFLRAISCAGGSVSSSRRPSATSICRSRSREVVREVVLRADAGVAPARRSSVQLRQLGELALQQNRLERRVLLHVPLDLALQLVERLRPLPLALGQLLHQLADPGSRSAFSRSSRERGSPRAERA